MTKQFTPSEPQEKEVRAMFGRKCAALGISDPNFHLSFSTPNYATFTLFTAAPGSSDVQTSTYTYEWIPRKAGVEEHWYCARDPND